MADSAEKGNSHHIPLGVAKSPLLHDLVLLTLSASSLSHVLEHGSFSLLCLTHAAFSAHNSPKLSFTFSKPWVSPPPRSFPQLPSGRHPSFAPSATITCYCASLATYTVYSFWAGDTIQSTIFPATVPGLGEMQEVHVGC